MNRSMDERSPLPEEHVPPPEEFPAPGPELTPPPEEFPPLAAAESPAPGRRRRKLLYALAAGALLLLLAGRLPQVVLPPEPESPPVPTDAPSPTAAPEPSPSPTPEPTPEPEPDCEILYYAFSSAHYARLRFTAPEAFDAVELTLVEPLLNVEAASYTLGPEEIAAGEVDLTLPDTGDLYLEHLEDYRALDAWPEWLVMNAELRYRGADGPVTETRSLLPSPEQGWSIRYWPEDAGEDEWSFPGCFRFATYESDTPVSLVLDAPEAAGPGVISVSFRINGRPVDADTVEARTWEDQYDFLGSDSPVFYFASLLFTRPAWAPERGVLHVTVVQYLEGYDRVLTLERDLPYPEDG